MAEQTQWLDGQAKNPRAVEKISPKRHIRQNQWQSEWNEMYLNYWSKWCYDYISDYECIFNHPLETYKYCHLKTWDNLQAAKQQGTHISIANLAHFTERSFAIGIITSGGFRGGIKKYNEDANGQDVKAKFSWWSPIFGKDDIKQVRDTLGVAIQPFIAELCDQSYNADDDEMISDQFHGDDSDQDDENDNDQDIEESSEQNDEIDDDDDQDDDQDDLTQQFATSEAFNPNAQRYGRFYFQYDINDLCDYYSLHFDGEVQFKILGTFSYKKEVMHAVLICSQENGNGLFKEYPHVLTPERDVNNEAVVTRSKNGDWVWKPQATGTVIRRLHDQTDVYPMYRRWERVAFAFHIPDEWKHRPENEAFMSVPDLLQNLHFYWS